VKILIACEESQTITKAERQKLRSKTFKGIANAIVDQWS
jgi:hypothetical protein